MTTIHFTLNKKIDINNRYISCSKSSYGMDRSTQIPDKIWKKIGGKSEQEIIQILNPIIEDKYLGDRLDLIVSELNYRRDNNEKEIFTIMETIVQKPIPIAQINATITTIGRCPYNSQERSLLYYPYQNRKLKQSKDSIKTVVHELLHMMVHHYYEDHIKEQGLSHEEFHELKESQTIILNNNYESLLTSPDQGYQSHQDLRNQLSLFWQSNQDFDQFIDFGIQLIKNNRIKLLK